MVVEAAPQAQVFTLRLPRLSEGRIHNILAKTDALGIAGKVYAEGGENTLHTHTAQDHTFIILDGEASFHDQDDNITVLKKYQGILLPKGAYYWFQSTGDTNLVMLRVHASTGPAVGDDRVGVDGQPMPGDSIENKHTAPVPVPGEFFGA